MTATHADDFSCFSDMHKDAYGFRPRGAIAERFNAMSDDEKRAEYARLESIIVESISNDLAEQTAALYLWAKRMDATAANLGVALWRVIRWDMEAHDCKASAYEGRRDYKLGFYCYLSGLGSGLESARIVAELARLPIPAHYGDL